MLNNGQNKSIQQVSFNQSNLREMEVHKEKLSVPPVKPPVKRDYKIDVRMTPNYEDNKHKPYFWAVLSSTDGEWANECSGWAETPEKAWEEAHDFYSTFKVGVSK